MSENSESYTPPTVLNRAQTVELMSHYWPADKVLDTNSSHFENGRARIMDQTWRSGGLIGSSKRDDKTGCMSDARYLPLQNTASDGGMTAVKHPHVLICCRSAGASLRNAEEAYFFIGDNEDGDEIDENGDKKDPLPSIILKTKHGIYTVWGATEIRSLHMLDSYRPEAEKLLGEGVGLLEWSRAERVDFHRVREVKGREETDPGGRSYASPSYP